MKKTFSFIKLFLGLLFVVFLTGCPAAPKDDNDKREPDTESVLESIYISKKPNKLSYEYNELLDLTGLEVKAKYDDNSETVITDWTSEPKNGTHLTASGTRTVKITYEQKTTSFTVNVANKPVTVVTADQYFWGTWQRMDNGQNYIIEEKDVFLLEDEKATNTYKIISSSQNELTVSTLGIFKKQSDAVMINGAIPYFRKGGSNLSYTMKLVGFEDTVATNNENTITGRAAKTDYIIKSKSKNYPSYSQETQADENGSFTLNAPVAGDEQIISINTDDGLVVVTGIKIDNDGANLGTIPLSKAGQYSLKVTGTIDESEKEEGYLYGNNYKKYPLTLTITNISEVTSAPSVCTIAPADPRLIVTATDGSDINGGVLISTLKKGFTKTISLSVECGSITEGYIDTGLIVNVKNAVTERNWQDFVPLRFYGGLVPITIAGESIESNPDAALNGFVVYPDGNSQFFTVPQSSNKIIYVPSFKSDKQFILSFSGATVQGTLSDSTEMLYTVAIGSSKKKTVDMTGSAFSPSVRFGEEGNKNETEETAFEVTEDFQAYLADGEIDYYRFGIEPKEVVNPDLATVCHISYINEYGDSPSEINIVYNSELTSNELPLLIRDDYDFDGWYIGNLKITEGYKIQGNITLTAKWKEMCTISYVTAHGTAPQTFDVESGTTLIAANLPALTENGWKFLGWYTNSKFDEDTKVSIGQSVTASITLYAKWEEYTGPELTDSVTVLPAGTNGTAGTSATYVLFGDWPQTIKADNVTIDENTSEVHGAFTYYSGSDGFWYVKCKENAIQSDYLYSNGTTVAQSDTNNTKYFKVEPIKWRVLTKDYKSTGKALLLAENILTANVQYYDYYDVNRTINDSTVYPNNYKESKIRAYLNGLYYYKQSSSSDSMATDDTYSSRGFLQTAFTVEAQNLIATTTVDNSATSTESKDTYGNNLAPATSSVCANTRDKIFLLSESEVTSSSCGFTFWNRTDTRRNRVTTDFAKANYGGGGWWLRSPYYDSGSVRYLSNTGYANSSIDVISQGCGIVPALSISLKGK